MRVASPPHVTFHVYVYAVRITRTRFKFDHQEEELDGEPPTLAEILEGRAVQVELRSDDVHRVVDRLKRKFGLGDRPKVRLALYKWLAALADEHGEPVLKAISVAVGQAVSARSPGRYFSSTVVRILRETSVISPGRGGGDQTW